MKLVPSRAARRLRIFTRDFPPGMLTVEIKRCPNLIIFDDYILLDASLPLPGASQTFLCRELTGALLEANICASHRPVSLLHETLNPHNQPKHIQAFILKIPTARHTGSSLSTEGETEDFGHAQRMLAGRTTHIPGLERSRDIPDAMKLCDSPQC